MDDQTATPAPTNSNRSVVIAIITGAVVIAGAIVLVTRGPDECAEWNEDLRVVGRQVLQLRDTATSNPNVAEEAADISADARRTIAEEPEDCEIDPETQEIYEDMSPPP